MLEDRDDKKIAPLGLKAFEGGLGWQLALQSKFNDSIEREFVPNAYRLYPITYIDYGQYILTY